MCSHFTLVASSKDILDFFGIELPADPPSPRYNIAPTQAVLVLKEGDQGRELAWHRWGLIPTWASDPSIGNRLINARGETVAEKPSFRSAFRKRRCLVLADGFYEWQAAGKKTKQPYLFRLRSQEPFAFAGLWESWQGGEEEVQTCTMVTTEANAVVRPVHVRMPVILAPEAYDRWLDPHLAGDAVVELLRPYPAEEMTATAVSARVNSPRFDDPACAEPVG
jgi:putative SOS response-associated peptidase YedK